MNIGINEQVLLGVVFFGAGLLLVPPLYLFGIPEIKAGFWVAVIATIILNVISQNLFIRAYKISDVSLISPLKMIVPVLVIISGFIF